MQGVQIVNLGWTDRQYRGVQTFYKEGTTVDAGNGKKDNFSMYNNS